MKQRLELPLSEETVRSLKIGDQILLSGVIFTGRDCVHKLLAETAAGRTAPPFSIPDMNQGVIYHCGPVVARNSDGSWRITAAGPTTSIREEAYMADVIRSCGLRGIIGKGGLGARTLEACRTYGCVYFHAVGGAAQILSGAILNVRNVYGLEVFGVPEAIWELEVRDFPVVVTMDTHGGNLHDDVRREAESRLNSLFKESK